MNLVVIAPAYFPDADKVKRLVSSCAHQHLPLILFGQGQPWSGDMESHFIGAKECIENLPAIYDHVMFTDAEDAFVVGGADEIGAKFEIYRSRVVMSAEQALYPAGLEKRWTESEWKRVASYGPWSYPNGGGWMGSRSALLELLGYTANIASGNEAQAKWIDAFCSGMFTLDCSCLIFQTMSGDSGALSVEGGRMVNAITGSHPVVLHWNGRMPGMEDTYKRIYSR